MDWIQVMVFIGANLGFMIPMFLWLRSEANSDRRDMQNMILAFHNDIQSEMKDFHGRLCSLEERSKK